MSIWSTFRYVPVIAPEAMAWATLSFATYLAGAEFQPQIGGQVLSPLALAVAVQLVLSTTRNMTTAKFARSYARAPGTALMVAAVIFCAFFALAYHASDLVAAKLAILYHLAFAAMLAWAAAFAPRALQYMQGSWAGSKTHRSNAVMLEAAGQTVIAATLFTTWIFANPMAFAAMMTFGVLVLRTLVNWVIVLYLIDAGNRDLPDGRDG